METPSISKEEAFISMIKSSKLNNVKHPVQNKFVKNAKAIPKLDISIFKSKEKIFFLQEQAVIGKFTSLWPSPRTIFIALDSQGSR
jgi:hypothetical protein